MLEPKTCKILYITCCENGFYCLKQLRKKGYQFSAVITISPSTAKKFNVSGYVEVTQWCEENNIKVIVLDDYDLTLNNINQTQYDVLMVNGWNRLIRKELIQTAKYGAIGIHAGHPPIGHGRSPLVWNIIKGMTDIEAYCFSLTPKADDGDILSIRTIEITAYDNARTLYEKVMYSSSFLFEEALFKKVRSIPGTKQCLEFSIFYPKRSPEDGKIEFKSSAQEIINFVRAQSDPYPGTFCYLEGKKIIVNEVILFDCYAFRDVQRIPGKIIAALPSGIVVQTGSSAVWIKNFYVVDENNNMHKSSDMDLENLEEFVGKILN